MRGHEKSPQRNRELSCAVSLGSSSKQSQQNNKHIYCKQDRLGAKSTPGGKPVGNGQTFGQHDDKYDLENEFE